MYHRHLLYKVHWNPVFYKVQKDFKYDIHLFSGSVKFSTEPIIQNIRDVNLKQLSEDIWMANEDTVLSGSNMNFKNITLKADVTIHVRKRKNYREKRYCLRKINYFNYLIIFQLFFFISESYKFIECKNVVRLVQQIIE